MSKPKTYVLTRAIRGAKVSEEGTAIELTDAQAQHPLYRNRVRLADLVPAIASGEEVDKKAAICKRLKELEIEFNDRWDADALGALLPGDELAALFPDD